MKPEDTDRQFHENLLAVGREGGMPEGMSGATRSACEAALRSERTAAVSRGSAFRRPALLSTLGIAAAIALVVGFFYQPAGNQEVNAAMVLARLDDQIEHSPRIDISIVDVAVEEVFVNGNLVLLETGIAGDIQARVEQEGEGDIEVDLTLGLCEEQGWVLIRKLVVPDPQAMAMINFFLAPSGETLIKLPPHELDFGEDFDTHMLMGDQIAEVIREIIASASEVGATVENRPDGTVLVTLPIKDAASLASLHKLKSLSGKNGVQIGMGVHAEHGKPMSGCHEKLHEHMEAHHGHSGLTVDIAHVEEDDDAIDDPDAEAILYGVTLELVYDPEKDAVRSLVIDNLGEMGGRISVTTRECAMDPSLFDSSRVTTKNTRVLDLAVLQKMFEGLDQTIGDGDEADE